MADLVTKNVLKGSAGADEAGCSGCDARRQDQKSQFDTSQRTQSSNVPGARTQTRDPAGKSVSLFEFLLCQSEREGLEKVRPWCLPRQIFCCFCSCLTTKFSHWILCYLLMCPCCLVCVMPMATCCVNPRQGPITTVLASTPGLWRVRNSGGGSVVCTTTPRQRQQQHHQRKQGEPMTTPRQQQQ